MIYWYKSTDEEARADDGRHACQLHGGSAIGNIRPAGFLPKGVNFSGSLQQEWQTPIPGLKSNPSGMLRLLALLVYWLHAQLQQELQTTIPGLKSNPSGTDYLDALFTCFTSLEVQILTADVYIYIYIYYIYI